MSVSEAIFRQGGERVHDWSRILCLTHERPDGDALGSIVALSLGACATGTYVKS